MRDEDEVGEDEEYEGGMGEEYCAVDLLGEGNELRLTIENPYFLLYLFLLSLYKSCGSDNIEAHSSSLIFLSRSIDWATYGMDPFLIYFFFLGFRCGIVKISMVS